MTSRDNSPEDPSGDQTKSGSGCRRRLAVAGLSLLIVLGLAVTAGLWRISRGPISLAFLEPRLVRSLGDDSDALELEIKNPAVTWGGWQRPVDLTAGPVVVSDHDGRTVVELQNISVGLAWLELFQKKIALTRIEVRSIHLHLLRTADGRIIPGFEETAKRAPSKPPDKAESYLAQKIQEALTSPEPVPPFERLTKVSVIESEATLEDRGLGVTWKVPNLDLHLRRHRSVLDISADATLDLESQQTSLKIDGSYDRRDQRLTGTVSVDDLRPDTVGHLIPALDPLTRVTTPVDLKVTADISVDGTLHTADLDLQSRLGNVKGTVGRTDTGGLSAQATLSDIHLSEFAALLPQLAALDQPMDGTASAVLSPDHSVEKAAAQIQTDMGQVNGSLVADDSGAATVELKLTGFQPWKLEGLIPDLGRFKLPVDAESTVKVTSDRALDSATLHLTCGAGAVHVPEIHGVPYRVQALTFQASATESLRSVKVSDFKVDLQGLTVRATGAATRGKDTTRITSSAKLTDFGVSSVDRYWPSGLVPDVLGWISANMTSGTVKDGAVQVALSLPSAPGGGVRIDDLHGSFGFSDLSVSYLSPMPPAVGLSGRCDFSDRAFTFKVDAGGVEDVVLGSATVDIGPLAGGTRLKVDATGLSGPVSTAARLLAGAPLELVGAGLPQPDQFSGTADTHLLLDIPLSSDDSKPLQVSGSSRIEDAGVTGWVKGYDLSDGGLDLQFDLDHLDLEGTALVNRVPASFTWHEDLAGGATPRTIHASATIDDQGFKALGVPDIRLVRGPIDVEIDLEGRRDGSMAIALDSDLTGAAVTIVPLGWSKPSGATGRITAQTVLATDRSLTVDQYDISADGFRASGYLATGPGLSSLDVLTLDRLVSGRTNLSGSVTTTTSGGWDIVVSGQLLDVRPAIDLFHKMPGASGDAPRQPSKRSLPPLNIDVRIQEVVDGHDHTLGRLTADASHDGAHWQSITGNLEITAGNVLRLRLTPSPPSGSDLRVTAHNAGEVLSALLPTSEVVGGALEITGHRATREGPLGGHVRVNDFLLKEADALTRILQLASIGGALDALSGAGLEFKQLDADYVLADKVLTIKDLRTHGSSIGITCDGRADFNHSTLNFTGAVVPVARIQSMLGKIPGLGVIITGTNKEGLLAVNYSVKGPFSNLDIRVNPLSGLTPGILRDMFKIPEATHK